MGAHDWITFEQGRARFAGGIRGWDEVGHETFAVELDGQTLYGEVKAVFLSDGNNFNIEIVSFGYFAKGDVAMPRPGHTSTLLSPDRVEVAAALIVQLANHVAQQDESAERPFVMSIDAESHFMGSVYFSEGWALGTDVQSGESEP